VLARAAVQSGCKLGAQHTEALDQTCMRAASPFPCALLPRSNCLPPVSSGPHSAAAATSWDPPTARHNQAGKDRVTDGTELEVS
jgi:hypothetical protein